MAANVTLSCRYKCYAVAPHRAMGVRDHAVQMDTSETHDNGHVTDRAKSTPGCTFAALLAVFGTLTAHCNFCPPDAASGQWLRVAWVSYLPALAQRLAKLMQDPNSGSQF